MHASNEFLLKPKQVKHIQTWLAPQVDTHQRAPPTTTMDPSNPNKQRSLLGEQQKSESARPISLLDRLPNEILDMIMLRLLAIQHDRSVPSVLIALGSQKDRCWYECTRRAYYAINANVTFGNEHLLNKRKLSDLQRIRHIRLALPLRFRSQKLTMRNRLETIIMDLTNLGDHTSSFPELSNYQYKIGDSFARCASMISWLVVASAAIHTVTVKLRNDQKATRRELLEYVQLGFEPRKEILPGEEAELLIWESTKILRWVGF